MKLQSLVVVVSAVSALAIQERFDASVNAVRQRTHGLVETTESRLQAFQRYLYERALTDESIVPEVLHMGIGQSISTLLGTDEPTAEEGPHHPPHKEPHHPPHGRPPHKNPHDQRDLSIWEFISESEYFTILTDIIKGDKHAVEELNKTSANLTLFAPTNQALEKYSKHAPPIEYLRKILLYHLLPEVYPAGRVLKSKTLGTLYHEEGLGKQRLSVDLNLRGLTLNYYARIIYVDIFTSNGVVHAIDNLLFPPPEIYNIAEVLPSSFSTFINAAWKTGLVDTLNETAHSTVFAPSNFGFAKLGPRINAYLFSKRGQPTLTKLLKYHIVPDVLFYSDYVSIKDQDEEDDGKTEGLVKHYEFETLLKEKINVDVGEWGRFKTIVFNGRTIGVSDIPAKNGVLSKLSGIILPYKRGMTLDSVADMSVAEFADLFVTEEDVRLAMFDVPADPFAGIDPDVRDSALRLLQPQAQGGCGSTLQSLSIEDMKDSFLSRVLTSDEDLDLEEEIYAIF